MEHLSYLSENRKHRNRVYEILGMVCRLLEVRANTHDITKTQEPELTGFSESYEGLRGLTYGSSEYMERLLELKPYLDIHYKNNLHHPEHYKNGIESMTLIDIVEMLADWLAATEKHEDGDINVSINHNQKRYKISDQLTQIFRNTVKVL